MKAGESIRESFRLYLENPLIIFPYILLGFLNSLLLLFATSYLQEGLAQFQVTNSFQLLFLQERIASALSAFIIRSLFIFAVLATIAVLVSSFIKAYTIGMAKQLARNRKAGFRDGIKEIDRTWQIFAKNIVVFLLMAFGTVLVLFTSLVLLGEFAIFVFVPASIIYIFIVYVVTFFSNQSIVLEKKGPWEGIVSSYAFIKRNMEDVAKVILFIIFAYASLQAIKLAIFKLANFFFAEQALGLLSIGIELLLFYIIMRPYFIILKTFYFVKNQRNNNAASKLKK